MIRSLRYDHVVRVQVDDESGSRQLCIGYYFRDDPQKVAIQIAAENNLDVHRRTAIHHKVSGILLH